jgi:Ca2+-transporting ATPase
VRLRVTGLRGRPNAVAVLEARVASLEGVRDVRGSAITGSLLVLFDPRRRLRALLADVAREAAAPVPLGPIEALPVAWHAAPAAAIIEQLGTDPGGGLSAAEAARRLGQVGLNELPMPRPKSALEIIRGHVASTPVLLLGGAAVLSVATGAVVEAAAIVAVAALNAAIGYVTERKVERILGSLQRVGMPRVLVRRDRADAAVPATALVPGDVVVLRVGQEVLADLRIVAAEGLALDESALTGESVPVYKTAGAVCDAASPLGARPTMAYAGTTVAEGAGIGVVVETGARTELGRLRTLVAESVMPPTPLERNLHVMGRRLVTACLGLCGATVALGFLRGMPVVDTLRVAVSLAVAAVPEGLPAVATTTLALGTHRMLGHRMLVRRLSAVEALGATTVICADKTGTLTENRMTVAGWHVAGRDFAPPTAGSVVTPALARAMTVALLCNDAELDLVDGAIRGSSTEGALLVAGRDAGIDYRALRASHPIVDVRPRLDGDHWMGTTHALGGRRLVLVKGAPESILARSTRWFDGGDDRPIDDHARAIIGKDAARLAATGLRVLGLAWKEETATGPVSYDELTWIGLVAFRDPMRAGAREAIIACRDAGIRTVILTGDHPETAAAIGRDLGLGRDGVVHVVEASALGRLDDEALRRLVLDADVFARVSPADKHKVVRALQAGGAIVAMTGDGINDAAALRAADIGVAMGARGTDVARDVADIVLLDDDLAALAHAVAEGRTIRGNITKSLRFLLATNFSEVLVTMASLALGRPSPLGPMQLLWINMLSDVLPAVALAVEPPEPDVMARPAPDPAQPLLTPRVLGGVAREGAVLAAATLGVSAIAGARHGAGAPVSTMAFSALTAGQLAHALTLRARGRAPRLLAGVTGGSIALHALAMTAPPLRRLLGTTPVALADWGIVALGAAAPLALNGWRRSPSF